MRVIAIDGPAGSGKSTVARAVARALGVAYLDTGAMYRSVALAVLRRGIDPGDQEAVASVARVADIKVSDDGVLVDGADATAEIRGADVTRTVSRVAANPEVRAELVGRQRAWATANGGGVVEGRDIGTVVFPTAALKVFLTAEPDERARRRSLELGFEPDPSMTADLARRDHLDSSRPVSPLAAAADAVVIDTTNRSTDEVVTQVLALAEARGQ